MSACGITDTPCRSKDEDLLNISTYVTGLKDFMLKCPTPMSIAIQGDWGTGKTSTINLLLNELEGSKKGKNDVKCVYFNTWQYSQFNMSDDLYMSFVNSLIKKFKDSEIKDKIKKSAFSLSKKVVLDLVEKHVGLDIEDIYNTFFEKSVEHMDMVERFRNDFRELVEKEFEGNKNARLLVFIDDLDRLNPEIAVELLEVIKLFMDVEKCIFVLAIDYDVVVSGVRSKYGQNVSETKCKSFFDKIIQLPFRMPVESYDLYDLIVAELGEYFKGSYARIQADFISSVMGTNPRAFKRLANSFFLIQSVKKAASEKNTPLDNLMVLCGLCVQLCVPSMYSVMVQGGNEWVEKLVHEDVFTIMNSDELKDYKDTAEGDIIIKSIEAFSVLFEKLESDEEIMRDTALKAFEGSFELTTITNVSSSVNKVAATAVKVDRIRISGAEYPVKNPTDALIKTYKHIIKDDPGIVNGFLEYSKRILTLDKESNLAYFRMKKELFSFEDKTVYIGTSSSTADKMKCVVTLCDFLRKTGEKPEVRWYDGADEVFAQN